MFVSTQHNPCVALIGITKVYAYDYSQACLLAGSFNYYSTKFKNILGVANNVTKIRAVIDTSNNKGYIDIYYNSANLNYVTVSLVQMANNGSQCYYVIEPQTVSEDVGDGYLITGSLDIITTD